MISTSSALRYSMNKNRERERNRPARRPRSGRNLRSENRATAIDFTAGMRDMLREVGRTERTGILELTEKKARGQDLAPRERAREWPTKTTRKATTPSSLERSSTT